MLEEVLPFVEDVGDQEGANRGELVTDVVAAYHGRCFEVSLTESVAAPPDNESAADAEQKSGQSKRALKEALTAQRRLSDRNSRDGDETEKYQHCNDKSNTRSI